MTKPCADSKPVADLAGLSPTDLYALLEVAAANSRLAVEVARMIAQDAGMLPKPSAPQAAPQPQPQPASQPRSPCSDDFRGRNFALTEKIEQIGTARPRGRYRYASIDRSEDGVVHAVAVNDTTGRTKHLRIERLPDGSLDIDEESSMRWQRFLLVRFPQAEEVKPCPCRIH
jgi:hypothetical protein